MTDKAGYTIRPAMLSDAEAISTLLPLVWVHTFADYITPEGIAQDVMPMFTLERVRGYLCDPKHTWLVAVRSSELSTSPLNEGALEDEGVQKEEGSVLGIAQLKDQVSFPTSIPLHSSVQRSEVQNSTYLARLFVHPSHHGTGLARALLLETERTARALGHDALWLVVLQQNTRGIRFYDKLGYVKVGEKPRKEEWFPHVGDIMLKRLSDATT